MPRLPPDGKTGGGAGKTRRILRRTAAAVAVAAIARTFLLQAVYIPTESMESTLLPGDRLFIAKSAYGWRVPFTSTRLFSKSLPQRGDIVVFAFPEDPSKNYIKRVVALPGDTVSVHGGRSVVNGQEAVEPYACFAGKTKDGKTAGDVPEFRVPPNRYFMMGDNRDRSYDSRIFGPVMLDALVGKAAFIYFSLDPRDKNIRWSRIGTATR